MNFVCVIITWSSMIQSAVRSRARHTLAALPLSLSLSLWRAVITVLLSDIEIIQISKNTDKISNNLNICCYGKPQKYHYRWWSILLLLVYNGYYSTTIYYKKYRYIDIRDL